MRSAQSNCIDMGGFISLVPVPALVDALLEHCCRYCWRDGTFYPRRLVHMVDIQDAWVPSTPML